MNALLKSIFFVFLVLFFHQSYAQTSTSRKQLFDDNWKFRLGDYSEAKGKDFDDANWRNVDLPHDWSIESKISPKNTTGGDGGFFEAGIGWYRKRFTFPESFKDKLISINFEGVYMDAEVFINGHSLGKYPSGYSPFSYDLTPFIQFGKENILSVRVDNSKQKNCRWYSGSGIYRHVWMITTHRIHIPQYGLNVATPKVTANEATIQVTTKVKNQTNQSMTVTLNTKLKIPGSNKTISRKSDIKLKANDAVDVNQVIIVSKPELWSVSSPKLYVAEVSLTAKNIVFDQNAVQFGIRSINYSAEKGFELNGKLIKLNGGCVHHDNGSLGAAAFDHAEIRKAEILKAAGFNAVRTSHNLPSEAFLTACDRLGLLVIDEAFDGWKVAKNKYDYAMYFDKWWKKDIDAMVSRDKNHPSIIMWSIGNEIIERKDPQAVQTAEMLAGEVKRLDPTRPVTSAMTTWDNDWEIFDPLMAKHDIAGYNYQLHRAKDDHKRVPARIILQTESYPRDAFANWKLVSENPYIIGDFVWTAMDYLGESGIGRWYYSGEAANFHSSPEVFPWHGAYCGDIDLTGWRKPISHYRSMLYNDHEKLYFAVREPEPKPLEIKLTDWAVWPTWESWTWPGHEGDSLQVVAYSKYPSVSLCLNGRLLATQATGINEEFKAVFNVPYAPGELTVAGVADGKELERKTLATFGSGAHLVLSADQKNIRANGQDLIYVTVQVKDDKGNSDPNANDKLQFNLDGPGKIIGVGNANLKDIEPYVGTTHQLWKGRALVIIRSTQEPGEIRLKVSSAKLHERTLAVQAIK
ncbi:beta-galactosidase [Pedobacter psychrotolerans]|uniref:Beta-galactosidase n=1 Tax=Pedobacter psychrotolerans TaxID=1843235 RepID=A0A4R2HCK0_9SPHI|nr:glycoside hydrolase family 2 TIM barrel-domain containing protein [Pedobacter psychrotolerans]TCO25387.1 beta-galactosidase [Pedobacter psychrotolerans]GGE45830.1 beta-galactosidase [Pedobacter psychrotolerans]